MATYTPNIYADCHWAVTNDPINLKNGMSREKSCTNILLKFSDDNASNIDFRSSVSLLGTH